MTVKRIDFAGRPYAAHCQDHWLEFTGNPNFPDYLRIVFVAYARHAANGHAKLERGELAQYLVRKDGTIPDRRNIWHALQKAIDLGYLLPSSQALCLVVSSDHVQGGGSGKPGDRCRRDHRKRVPNDASRARRFASNDVGETGRSNPNDVTDPRRSTLAPSLSSASPTCNPQPVDQASA